MGQLAHVGECKYVGQVPPTSVFLQEKNENVSDEATSATYFCCSPTKEEWEISFESCVTESGLWYAHVKALLYTNWRGSIHLLSVLFIQSITCQFIPPAVVPKYIIDAGFWIWDWFTGPVLLRWLQLFVTYGKWNFTKQGRRCGDFTDTKLLLQQERQESELGPDFFLFQEARSSTAVGATLSNLAFQDSGKIFFT